MNDTELDELLDKWGAPPAPNSLRQKVRAGFAASQEYKAMPGFLARWLAAFARNSLVAGALIGAGALLFLVAQAFPQTLGRFASPGRIPYTVDSELIRFTEDGSSAVALYIKSYNDRGREITLSRSVPGDPLTTFHLQVLDLWQRLALYFSDGIDQSALLREGCVAGFVTGRETILNHSTVASQRGSKDRLTTLWMAPDLGCFALKIEVEKPRPDGTFRLVSRRQALKVTVIL